MPRGDAAEHGISFEVFDEQLPASPIVVKTPEVQRPQRQIRDEDLGLIRAELEQRQLGRRFFGSGRRTTTKREGCGPRVGW